MGDRVNWSADTSSLRENSETETMAVSGQRCTSVPRLCIPRFRYCPHRFCYRNSEQFATEVEQDDIHEPRFAVRPNLYLWRRTEIR